MFIKKKESGMLRTRIASRKSTDVKGLYKILDRSRFYARNYMGIKSAMDLIDISVTGLAFKVKNLIPKGSYVEIEIGKLSDEDIFDTPISVACETVYCRYHDRSGSRVGAKFLEIHTDDVEKIRQFTEEI